MSHIPDKAVERRNRFIVSAYLEAFCKGRRNARTKDQIRKDTRISGRAIEKAIEQLNKAEDYGICSACSDPKGYFIAQTSTEVYEYIEQLEGRIESLKERHRSFIAVLRQMKIDEEKTLRQEEPRQGELFAS